MMVNNTQPYKNEAGQIIIIIAFLMIAMIAMLGLAVDGGGLMLLQRDVQNASDAAIVAATYARCSGGNDAQVIYAARDAAKVQGFEHGVNGVTVDVDPNYTGSTATAKYIEVTINSPKDAYFIKIVYKDPLSVTSESVGRCTPVRVESSGGGGGTTIISDVGIFAAAPLGCLGFEMDSNGNGMVFNRSLIFLGDTDITGTSRNNDYSVPTFVVGGDYGVNGNLWRNKNINGPGGQPESNMDTSLYSGGLNLYNINHFDSTHPDFAFAGNNQYVNLDQLSGGSTADKLVNAGLGRWEGGNSKLVVHGLNQAGAIVYSANPIIINEPSLSVNANLVSWVSRDRIIINISNSQLNKMNGDLPLFFSDLGNDPAGCTSVTGPTGIDVNMTGGSLKGPSYAPKSHLHFAGSQVTHNSCLVANTIDIDGSWNQSGGCDVKLGGSGSTTIIPPSLGIAE